MKQSLLIILFFLLITTSVQGQSDYCRGFESGYKNGYCYGDAACTATVPICVEAISTEKVNSWQDGYNRGFEKGSDDKKGSKHKNSKIQFQQSVGMHIIAVGNYNSPSVGVGLYYAPRLAIKIGKESSLSFGTNIQYIQGGAGFGLGLPLMLGLNFGSGSTRYSDKVFGGFVNLGLSQVLYTEDPDNVSFHAPIIEGGIRVAGFLELRISIVKQRNDPANGFLYAGGIGYVF